MATSRSEDPLAAVDQGLAEINGHHLYWELYGDPGDPVALFLHHGLGSIMSWRRQIPAFVEGGWQVLVYDRWGYGRSDERPAFELGYLAEDAREAFHLADTLGLKEMALVGHSDGGSIALLMASGQPGRITAMAVVAAHIYYEPKMALGLDIIANDPNLPHALAREHGERAERLIASWAEHWRRPDSQALNMLDHLPAVSCPTLVVQGCLDEHATAGHAEDIARHVQDGHLWLIPDVKHMPPHEIPVKFNQRLLDFLAI